MSTISSSVRLLAVAAAAMLAFQAQAATRIGPNLGAIESVPGANLVPGFVDVNLTGYQTFGDFGDPANSQVFLNLGAGTTVTGWDFTGLSFTTSNGSWLSEFVISVSNIDGTLFLDATVSDLDEAGTFGPADGSFATAPLSGGAPFVTADGTVWVTVYETFTDPGLNASVSQGNLRIYYDTAAVIPEPATYGLMGLGLLGVLGAVRRRRSH